MARTKKNEQAPKEKEETPVEVEASQEAPVVEAVVEETVVEAPKVSGSYAEFADFIERYKIQNPVKYEQKKEVLLAQLNALK